MPGHRAPSSGLADRGRFQDAEVLQDRLGDDRVSPPSAEDDQREDLRVQAIRLLFLALPVALVDADESPDEHRARHVARGAAPEVIHQGDPPNPPRMVTRSPSARLIWVIFPLPAGGGVSSLTY